MQVEKYPVSNRRTNGQPARKQKLITTGWGLFWLPSRLFGCNTSAISARLWLLGYKLLGCKSSATARLRLLGWDCSAETTRLRLLGCRTSCWLEAVSWAERMQLLVRGMPRTVIVLIIKSKSNWNLIPIEERLVMAKCDDVSGLHHGMPRESAVYWMLAVRWQLSSTAAQDSVHIVTLLWSLMTRVMDSQRILSAASLLCS